MMMHGLRTSYLQFENHPTNYSKEGYNHVGVTFANGLEWVMYDQVDIDFMNKSDFESLKKKSI